MTTNTTGADDLMEYIYLEDGIVKSNIFTKMQLNDAETLLKSLTCNIRLDFHNILDLLDSEYNFKVDKTICCISFVGKFSKIREFARKDIKTRIESKQINFGLLIFARGHGKNRNNFTVPGSKAWANKLIQYNPRAIFIDDAKDHVQSTRSLRNKKIIAYLIDNRDAATVIKTVEEFE